jgi:hypothetical protein
MNLNVLLAVLEYKEIITEEQAIDLADNFANGIQSAHYKDAQAAVKKILADK